MIPIPSVTRRRLGALCLLAMTIAAPRPLPAQQKQDTQSVPEETKPDATAVQLETYTVTDKQKGGFKAERVLVGSFRDMNPVDVPATFNVVTREVLDAQGARTIYDAVRNTA